MPRSIMDDSYDPIYEQVKGILGEHFEHYCFIVMDDMGEVFFDYDHLPAGRMLLSEAGEEMRIDNPDFEIEWEFEELDDDEDSEEEGPGLAEAKEHGLQSCLLYTSPSPRD